jgi:hypothetical protein
MRLNLLVLLFVFFSSAKAQFNLMPHNVGLSYFGEMATHPGAKLSLMYNLDHWNKVKKSKRGLAKTRIRDLTLNVNLGFYIHNRYQTGVFFLPEFEYSQSNRKGWYWATGVGAGYLRSFIDNTYEVQKDGSVKRVNAGHNYGMASVYFTYGRDLYIAKKQRWRFFVKPQFAMAFPSFPAITGYFFLELGVAYKLRYL